MRIPTPRPTALVAVLALCLATGGVGYAAGSLPKNSVGSKQVKNGALKGKDLKNNAVTSTKVKDDSLTGADIAEGTLDLPRTGTAVLSGGDFLPTNSTTAYTVSLEGELTPLSAAFFAATPPVPAGATVTGVRVYVVDNSAGSDVGVQMVSYTPSTRASDLTAPSTSTTGQSSAVQALTPAVLSPTGSKVVRLLVTLFNDPNVHLVGAEVDYE